MNKRPYINYMKDDIAIHNCHILTFDEEWKEFPEGLVLLRDNRISYVGNEADNPAYKAERKIDAHGGIVMPPFFNGHTHSAMSILRGLGSEKALKTWLEDYIWPAEAKFVNEENVFLGSMISAIEMIKGGTGIFCDMYFFQEETAKACEELGIRMIMGEGVLDFPTPNKKSPEEGLILNEYLCGKYINHPLIELSIPAHAPYTCSPPVLEEIGELARRFDVPTTTHLAETEWETGEMKKRYGKSSTELLLDTGFIEGKSVAYHCNYLSVSDIQILHDNKVGIVSNPKSNMKLGSGICPVPELMETGLIIGIGSDGAATNNNSDLLSDIQFLPRLHKMNKLDPTIINAKQVLRMAVNNSAEIYGMDDRIGSIETGKLADMIIINTDQVHWQPLYDPYASIVYAMQPEDVDTTIINGKVIMEDRQIMTADEEEFQEKIKTAVS